MKRNLLHTLIVILVFAGVSKISAQQNANSVAGKWKVTHVIIADKDTSKPSGLRKDNSVFGYMMDNNMPVEFKSDGTVELRKENSRVTWKYELNGDEIKLISVESNYGQATVNGERRGDLQTYVIFKIQKKDNQLSISRNNHLFSETYILEQ